MLEFMQRDGCTIVHRHGRLGSRDFARLVAALAERLKARGIPAGARVAAYLSNSPELLVTYYACLRHGWVIVPINERLGARAVQTILAHSDASCIVTAPGFTPAVAPLGRHVLVIDRIDTWLPDSTCTGTEPGEPWPDEHPAVLFYTSGSTGVPKGVLYSYGTLRRNARLFAGGLRVSAEDHVVLCHCMSSNFVFAQLTVPFLDAGATVEIVEFGNVEQTIHAIERGATFLSLIPWFGYQLIDVAAGRRIVPNRLRMCLVGGDRVPLDFFARFRAAFGIVPAEQMGMAETNTTLVNPLVNGDLRLGSAGVPLPGVEVQIRSSDGRVLPAGGEGEIWVKTSGAMARYWNEPELTRETIRHGWVATGDIGYRDGDGYVWFTGRAKQILVVDGDNIHPRSIERVIAEHPRVKRVYVIGLPHPTRGASIAAAVVLRTGDLTQPELAAFLEGLIAPNMIPSYVLVLDELPKNEAGKIDRSALVRAFTAAQTRRMTSRR